MRTGMNIVAQRRTFRIDLGCGCAQTIPRCGDRAGRVDALLNRFCSPLHKKFWPHSRGSRISRLTNNPDPGNRAAAPLRPREGCVMTTLNQGRNCRRPHAWEAIAQRLRGKPRTTVFIASEGHGCANPYTLASAARGGLRREGLVVRIETSFENGGIYVALVRDLTKKKSS